jgi:hypothetical protein
MVRYLSNDLVRKLCNIASAPPGIGLQQCRQHNPLVPPSCCGTAERAAATALSTRQRFEQQLTIIVPCLVAFLHAHHGHDSKTIPIFDTVRQPVSAASYLQRSVPHSMANNASAVQCATLNASVPHTMPVCVCVPVCHTQCQCATHNASVPHSMANNASAVHHPSEQVAMPG